MIAFSCSHCGMKLKVKPEFAGRSSRCPTCKQPLLVPALEQTAAYVPQGPLDGPPSSIAKAGLEGGVTLDQAPAPATGPKPVPELLAHRTTKADRYLIEGEIARGGMGAVLRAVDCDIRREVAVKFLLDQADPNKKLRFVEEAQITGQLEHPNIVPIHELGVDSEKRLFFAMKMVKGRSLAQVLDDLRTQPKTAEKEYPLSRLLTIFINICNGLAYAHARGVVHRDLKPANIMVGEFGEVYVMDWGLAKLLKSASAAEVPVAPVVAGPAGPAPTALPVAEGSLQTSRSGQVATSREPEADLTQEGAVLGTPFYMPPEQAAGQISAIDQRSDIYSLGAILYEMLTLQPPVDREGGHLAVLLRVAAGEIIPPHQRESDRARAGKVPRELSSVAMKALAKAPADRYPTVAALRGDVERFLEGRSVSAKADSAREMLVKLVKRNKGVSVAAAIALAVLAVVLAMAFQVNYAARLQAEESRTQAEQAFTNYQAEQRAKEAAIRRSVPALVRAGRLLANDGDIPLARAQVEQALTYAPDDAEARWLKAQILIAQDQWAASRTELAAYLQQRPDDTEARSLLAQIAAGKAPDTGTLFALAEAFQRQKVPGLAAPLLQRVQNVMTEREPLLPVYQKQIEEHWKGLGKRLTLEKDAQFKLNLSKQKQVPDLRPLKGIPLHRLDLEGCSQLVDLAPLQGMPLTSLNLHGCQQVKDLKPLQGLPLTWLNLDGCPIQDLKRLQGMKLTSLSLKDCGQVSDLSPLQGMPLTELSLFECRQVQDVTPLGEMPLTLLNLWDCSKLRDLTPLQDLHLTEIKISPGRITKGMDGLRAMKSLKWISTTWNNVDRCSAEEFWKQYDAKKVKK